ncbi:MAG TPA: peptidyl-prolyl cis-trans isomerase [Vicinamibacterales bacterium]|nr:peptidyl-prolyl cis-trans isomerase [Vicinamibacterales bacterium]
MLDRMRRHKGWLKWSLGIVVVTFVALYVPSCFLSDMGVTAAPTGAIATVNGRKIPVATFQRAYTQQAQAIRSAYGDQFNDQMLQQLGIGPRVLDQLVNDEAILIEAERLGIRVSDTELRDRILTIPGLQQNGQFVGWDQYRAMLQRQRPPVRPDEFENEIRKQLIGDKLQAQVTGWIHVPDSEIQSEFTRRNEKLKLELAVFTANEFRKTIQPTDAEIAARFEANKEEYRLPEKRRVRFLAVDANSLKSRMTASNQEIEALYRRNEAMYSTPEQIRSSHILFKTEGKDDATVKKAAEAVLAKVKAGGDFAALAKQYSEDSSKDQGGDLSYSSRGGMVKEFDDVAWELKIGETSGLVKSQYGYHIIKLVDRKAANKRTMTDVRPQLEDQIKTEKAQAEATKKADELAPSIKTPADLDRVAREQSLAVGDSGLFSRDEPLAGIGFAPAVAAKAFELEVGKVSEKLQTGQGFAWITVVETKPSVLPTLEEVKTKVKDDVIRVKAVDVARAKAETMAKGAAANFAAAAKAAGVEVKTTELITRGQALPEIGVNQAVEDVVFKLKTGEATGAIATDNAVVVARVKERQDPKPGEFETAKTSLAGELKQQRQNQFFAAYMGKAREKMKITYSDDAFRRVLGIK